MMDFYALGWAIGEALSYGETFEPIDFKAARKSKSCNKGYPCKGTCISARYNCRNALEGQAKSFGDYIKSNLGKLTQGQKSAAKNIGINPKTGKQSGLTNKERVAIQKSVAGDKTIKSLADRHIERQRRLKQPPIVAEDGQMLLFPVSNYIDPSKATRRAKQHVASLEQIQVQLKKDIKKHTDQGKIWDEKETATLQGTLDRVNKQIARQKRIADGKELPAYILRGTEKQVPDSETTGKTGTLTKAERLLRSVHAQESLDAKAEQRMEARREARRQQLEEDRKNNPSAEKPAQPVTGNVPKEPLPTQKAERVLSTHELLKQESDKWEKALQKREANLAKAEQGFTRTPTGPSGEISKAISRFAKEDVSTADQAKVMYDLAAQIGKTEKPKTTAFKRLIRGGEQPATGEGIGDFAIATDTSGGGKASYYVIHTPTGLSVGRTTLTSKKASKAALLIAHTHLSGRDLVNDPIAVHEGGVTGKKVPHEASETEARLSEIASGFYALDKFNAKSMPPPDRYLIKDEPAKKPQRQEALATEIAQTEKDRLEEAWTGKKKAPEPARSVQPTPDAAKDAPRPEPVRLTQFTREVSGHSARIAESVGRLKDGMDAGDAKQLALDISKEIGKSKKLKQGTFESAKAGGNITVTGEVAGDFGIEKDANAKHSFDKYQIIYTPTGLSIGSASSQSNARAAALIADAHLTGRKLEKALSDVTNARKDDAKGSEPKESTETYTRTLEVMTMISALEKTSAGSAASYIPDDRIFRPKKSGDNPDLKKKQPEAKAPGTAKAKPKASETKQVSSPDAVVDDSLNKSGKAHDIADRPKQHVIKSGKEYQWSADVLGGKESPKFKTQREAVKELEVLAKKEQYFEYRKAKSAYQAMVDSGGVKYDGMVGRNRYDVTLPSGKKEVWKESDNDLMKEMKMPSFYSKEAQSLLYPERLLEARPQYSQDDIKTIWGGKTPV
ncbi:MAG: hypothetical protein ACRC8Y_26730 [Chroococcales cyanobacterium]